jgi:hypothetical protein
MAIPGKNSFLLYHDQRHVIEALSDDQAGKLIKLIYRYSEMCDLPQIEDPVLNIAFIGIKSAMDRACEKYEKVKKRNQENGKKGGRPSNKNSGGLNGDEKPTGLPETHSVKINPKNPDEPRKADSDSDSEPVFK